MKFINYKLQSIVNFRLAHLQNLVNQFVLLRALLTNELCIHTSRIIVTYHCQEHGCPSWSYCCPYPERLYQP